MKLAEIDVEKWETVAQDRTAWRGAIKTGLASGEAQRVNNAQLKRARRKARMLEW